MGHWGTCPHWSLMHAKFCSRFSLVIIGLSRILKHWLLLLWQAVAQNFSHIRFCRPNARWLSLLDDFVTTNFGTRAPRTRARPWSKILATPLLSLTVNVVTFSRPTAIYVLWCRPYQHFWDEPTSIHRAKPSAWCSVTQCVHCQHVTSTDFRGSTAPPPQKLGEQPLTLLPMLRRPC